MKAGRVSLEQQVSPVTLANEELLAVPEALSPLFPRDGLQRGWSVGFSGTGGWSLAMAMLGTAIGANGWAACVGLEEFGLVAADEVGVQLDRLLMVESPGPDHLASVIASLVEVVDVICIGPASTAAGRSTGIGIRDARRLMARAREQNAVLFHLDGGRSWPQPLDVDLETEAGGWTGIGRGHGSLATRRLLVRSSGRRSMARPRHVDILLPGPDGPPAVASADSPAAGPVVGLTLDSATDDRTADGVAADSRTPVMSDQATGGVWPVSA